MRPTIGICTDSGAQLPRVLIDRYDIEVVPLTVTVDEVDHLDGIDLDVDAFYTAFTPGHRPEVTTSPPSPGQFAVAFEDLIARGCTEIVSIHGTHIAATILNAARLAVHSTQVPVRLVDTGIAGFGVGCSVWAAAEAVAAGASLDEVAQIAESLPSFVGKVFVWSGDGNSDGVAVMRVRGRELDELCRCTTMAEAVNAMAAATIAAGEQLRVGVGYSDAASEPVAEVLENAIGEAASVLEVVRFRIGPAMSMFSAPGTIAAVSFPAG